MIKSLSIKNIATFQPDGIEISDLKKVNFIYGANGSGKTTISNYLQEPENPSFSFCSLKWENDIPLTTHRYPGDNFNIKDFPKKVYPSNLVSGDFYGFYDMENLLPMSISAFMLLSILF